MSTITQVTVTEEVTDLTVSNTNAVSLNLTTEDVSVSINNFAIPINFMDAANVVFAGHNTVTANNVSDAIKQLADQNFRGTTALLQVQQTWRKETFFTIQTIIK